MAATALQALRRAVTIEWPRHAERDAKALLIRTARAGHARIMREQAARAGIIPEWTAYANTPGNTNIESVQLPGPIVYRYRYLREITLALMRALEAASPVYTGAYRKSHTLYIDGVPASLATPIRPGQEVMIANPLPYSRRLEIGKTESGRDFLVSMPNRIYERTAKGAVARRYRNAASITFGYATLPNAHMVRGGLKPSYAIGGGQRRKRRQNKGSSVQSPAIFIAALGAGG